MFSFPGKIDDCSAMSSLSILFKTRFARDCMTELRIQLDELEKKLGQGTTELKLRCGLNRYVYSQKDVQCTNEENQPVRVPTLTLSFSQLAVVPSPLEFCEGKKLASSFLVTP